MCFAKKEKKERQMHSIVHAAILLVGNVFVNSDTSPKMLTEVEHLIYTVF